MQSKSEERINRDKHVFFFHCHPPKGGTIDRDSKRQAAKEFAQDRARQLIGTPHSFKSIG